MKPEPLTKEKIRYLEGGEFKEMEVPTLIKNILDKIYPEKEYEYFSKDLLEDEIDTIKQTLEFIKQRVNWLLKEIEKKQEQIEKSKVIDIHTKSSFKTSLDWCKNLIKKAFSGVIEE